MASFYIQSEKKNSIFFLLPDIIVYDIIFDVSPRSFIVFFFLSFNSKRISTSNMYNLSS